MISECVFRRTRNTIPVSSAFSAPHIWNPVRPMCTLTATQLYQSTPLQSIQPVPLRSIQPLPPQSVCNYCQKPDHARQNCRMADELCLACGSGDHSLGECPHRRMRNNTPAFAVFPIPPVRGKPITSSHKGSTSSSAAGIHPSPEEGNVYSGPRKSQVLE